MTLSKLKVAGLFFLLMTMNQSLFATTGCLVGSSLYTSSNGTGSGKTYYDTSPSINASGFCLRSGTSTSACQTRTWFLFFWVNGDNGINGDFGASNPPAYCPMDDHVWLLLLGFSTIGFTFMRKRLKLILEK